MAYFTQEQIKWLNKLGAEDWRNESSCIIRWQNICTNVVIEAWSDEFRIEIFTPWNIIIAEFGDNLEETLNNAIKRYKDKVKVANIVAERLDGLVQKSEGILK